MCFSVIYFVLFIFSNYPPDLSPPIWVVEGPPLNASVIPLPNETNVGSLGKLPTSLIPADLAPEPKIEVKVYVKSVRPWYNQYLYGGLLLIPLSLGCLFFSPFPA